MSLAFHLKHFDGPMDLLLHLIKKNEIDIYDIPITLISEQYLEYINEAKEMNLEIASDFLLFATQLIQIKVKMLLPKQKLEEDDPRTPLIEKILEYQFVQEISIYLREQEEKETDRFSKKNDEHVLQDLYKKKAPLEKQDPKVLWQVYHDMLLSIEEEPLAVKILKKEQSIVEIAGDILLILQTKKNISFKTLVSEVKDKYSLIGFFLALLDCIHQKKIWIIQKEAFGNIWIQFIGESA